MTQRILLADDSVTIRKVVEFTFSDEDFLITSVGDGGQALERARAERPDIILSDVIMPGLNGYELCQQIKGDPSLRSVPFLFLKGTFESFDEEKAQACGADGFIVKPFESQEMIRRVKELIAGASGAAAPPPLAVSAAKPRASAVSAPPDLPEVPRAPAPRPAAAPPPVVAPVRPPVPPPLPVAGLPARPTIPVPPAIPQRPPGATPAAAPPLPLRASAPAPPIPVRPAAPVPPPIFVPPLPAPAVAPLPVAPPPVRPVIAPPPAPAPARPIVVPPEPREDDFGFSFGDTEPAARATLELDRGEPATAERVAKSEDDLWSEVSLRDRGAGAIGDAAIEEEGLWGSSGRLAADDSGPVADDLFEEVSTARRSPTAAAAPEPPPVAPATSFAAPGAPVVAVGSGEIERQVAARVEEAVRLALPPLVGELARKMIEEIAWEVVPELAEAMIRAEIERVTKSVGTG